MPRPARPWFYKQTGWWMAYVGGKKAKLAKGRANRRDAERKLRELLHLRDLNPDPEVDSPTVASLVELYLGHAGKRLGERTLYERKHYLQAFAEALGWRQVADCKPFHLTAWLDANPQWKSDWTLATVIKIVQRPFNWAARQRLIAANPFQGVSHRPGEPRRPMTDEEFEALLVACEGRKTKKSPSPAERFREVVRFLRYTGARPGEACRLRWDQVDCNNGVIIIERHKTSRTQRAPKPRIIPLHPEVVRLLITIKQRNEPGAEVFHNHRGTPWNRSSLRLRVQRARGKAGIPDDAKLYGLRHRFGTRSIVNGVDIKTLAELLGHSSTRMTEHYLHLAGQRAHLAAAMLRANAAGPGA